MKAYNIQTKSATYNETTGISKVWIATDIGDFFGEAKLNPEDKDIESHFAGPEYAEMRAIISYAKEKIKIIKYQLKLLEQIKNELLQTKTIKHDLRYNNHVVMNVIDQHLNRLTEVLNIITKNKENLEIKLKNDIATRREKIEYIEKVKIKLKEKNNNNNNIKQDNK